MLPETFKDMKKKMFEVYDGNPFFHKHLRNFGWVVDFGVDSLVNLALRKTDAKNFAALHEGNLYNNLFNKVP